MPEDVKTINGKTWRTPLTELAPRRVGSARLIKKHYRGTYHYEGTGGFEYFYTPSWMPVVALQQRRVRSWATWMVDDPLHWDGMREAVEMLPAGRILVAGLGLGLFAHHMATEPRFTSIAIVESNKDVVGLIAQTLPHDDRRTIVVDDFYRFIEHESHGNYDGVLWDLAVGDQEQTLPQLIRGEALSRIYLRTAKLVQFGLRVRTS